MPAIPPSVTPSSNLVAAPDSSRGFTLIELMTVIVLIAVALVLSVPSWDHATQKRRITGAAEQVAAMVTTAQSEAIKRNQPVSLAFQRLATDNWCIGMAVGDGGCDCMESNPAAAGFCAIEGAPSRHVAGDFQGVLLRSALDNAPGAGDGRIVFDPVRGILTPVGDRLALAFESQGNDFQLDVRMSSTGLMRVCNPGVTHKVPGYLSCL